MRQQITAIPKARLDVIRAKLIRAGEVIAKHREQLPGAGKTFDGMIASVGKGEPIPTDDALCVVFAFPDEDVLVLKEALEAVKLGRDEIIKNT